MRAGRKRATVGAAALALGLVVAGPQGLGVAAADRGGSDASSSSDSGPRSPGSAARSMPPKPGAGAPNRNRVGVPGAAATAAKRNTGPVSTKQPTKQPIKQSTEQPTGNLVTAVADAPLGAPDPTATATTQYGELGKWMLQPNGQIADWVGLPYQNKTLLEGINVVFIDTAATTARQAERNLNVWMRRAAFGASQKSSTGYQGILGGTTYSQQPTGPGQAFRDAIFLLPNNHGRAFGAYLNEDGDYVFTGAWSRENLDIKNFSHGHESFNQARTALLNNMVAKGATNLGEVDMGNAIPPNDPTYSTGDADGKAIVLGWNVNMGTTRAYRGAPPLIPLPSY